VLVAVQEMRGIPFVSKWLFPRQKTDFRRCSVRTSCIAFGTWGGEWAETGGTSPKSDVGEESRKQKEENRKQKCISAFKKSVIRYSLEKLVDMAVRASVDWATQP